ncbi:hypothetical protein Kpol_242p5 [Vanderwaltozyma polyspora DSM 70294]|uniref:Sec66p n=1 Tax=Vanderwaltozyma polyspora (strain ATCC 22028 / DSM 70294 / BCRC 21397 / CBS 2163 / NBRC 10782 / NRRL Y-8283 / UCD 57-17) TaxID=436907 RepID=A7TTC5_VANPO|nr:uncharacterized protein Kpol_242p5 [Vanderwaltozyma polyspora DSM 70294]EDO14482.1 hypothetical protein Kpol_242p5 [Vanderwaltozyma polyspora DSM 70294]
MSQSEGSSFYTTVDVETKLVSVYTPLIYGSLLILSLIIFGSQYRKKQIKELSELKSIFDENEARDLYYELKSKREEDNIHEKVIKAALLNRGAEAVRRSIKLKELSTQIEIIYKNGGIGDDYWKRFQNEVKLVDLEFKETLQEAEMLQPGWVQLFVALSKEICFNQALSRRYDSIARRTETCIKEWNLKLDDNGRLIE